MLRISSMATTIRTFRKSRVVKVSRLVIIVNNLKYRYKPLPDETSIRLLALDPGKDGDPLTGTLEVIHLHRPAPNCDSTKDTHSSETGVTRWTPDRSYEAISYVWGSDVKDHIILLGGKTHRITANLSDALHQCRLSDQSRALWADSICIDQDNLDEKSHQVYMMSRVYASSQRTLICLGHGDQDHARDASAMTADVNKMLQQTSNSPDFSWGLDCFPWPLPGEPLVNDSRWQSIDILCLHPWFSRGWVIQEAALGHEALILWAGCRILLSDVTKAEMWYARRVRPLLEKEHREKSMPLLLQQVLRHRQRAETRIFYGPSRWVAECDILFALNDARTLGLRDPRDRIFAFTALPFVKCPMPILHPNYKQSHLELYQEFIIKYLEHTSDLNFLSYTSHGFPCDESLDDTIGSSWVPRWDHPHWHIHEAGPHMEEKFGQQSKKPADFVISLGESGASASLQVRAIIFDSIKLVSPLFKLSTTIEDLTTFWSYWSKQAGSGIYSRQDQPIFDYESLAFLAALTRGNWAGRNTEEWADSLKSYSRFLWSSAQGSESPDSPQLSPDIQDCHRHLMIFANGSHSFSLNRGYRGLASRAIEQNDVCAFVFGVRNPIILRQVPDAGTHHYKVIGPAFIVSKRFNRRGTPLVGLNRWKDWVNWSKLCENEGLADWRLKEQKVVLL